MCSSVKVYLIIHIYHVELVLLFTDTIHHQLFDFLSTDSSIHYDFVKDSVAFVYWQSIKERTLHKARVSCATVCYLQEVHYILKELENNSLNDWTCDNTVAGDDNDELLYLSCVALFTVEDIDNL